MSTNPHIEYAEAAFGAINAKAASEFNEALRADALIQATLAVAWETARLADAAHTANLIAGLQPVEILGKKEWKCDEATVLRIRGEISERLYPEGASK